MQQQECTVRKSASDIDSHSQGAVQVSMKLRLAQMWDHNGTNMETLGFMYRNYQVLIVLDADDSVKGDVLTRTSMLTGWCKAGSEPPEMLQLRQD